MADQQNWQVTTQQETARPDATGRFVSGVLVGFTTNKGVQGTVFVPDAQYTPETVRQMIQDRVDQMHGVQDLRG